MKNKSPQEALYKLVSYIKGDNVQDITAPKGFDLANLISTTAAELGSVECHLVDSNHIEITVADLTQTQYLDHAPGRFRQVLAQIAFGLDEIRFPGSHKLPLLDSDVVNGVSDDFHRPVNENKQPTRAAEIAKIRLQAEAVAARNKSLLEQGVEWLDVYGFDITFTYVNESTIPTVVNVVTSNKNGERLFFSSKRIQCNGLYTS